MLQTESMVDIVDNTGAKKGLIIRILKGSDAKKAIVGDRVVVAIKDALTTSTFKKGDVSRALIVRTKGKIRRKDGSYIGFGDNAAVLIQKDPKEGFKALGKRIF